MKIKNTSRYPSKEVAHLVTLACAEFDMSDVQVNVKDTSRGPYKGYAYFGVPRVSPASRDPSVRHLVTIHLGPSQFFPCDNLVKRCELIDNELVCTETPYGGPKAPLIKMRDWREALVTTAAHEAEHVKQNRTFIFLSERACEHAALRALQHYRKNR